MILKIVRKSMLNKKVLLIPVIVLTALAVVFRTVAISVYETFEEINDEMYHEGAAEDFRLFPVSQLKDYYTDDLIKEIETKEKVLLEQKLVYNYDNEDSENPMRLKIHRYEQDAEINKPIIKDGSLPTNKDEVMLLQHYMEIKDLKVGDKYKIGNKEYTISGSGYFVDEIFPNDMLNGIMYPTFDTYNVVYMNSSSFDDLSKEESNYTLNTYYSGISFKNLGLLKKDDLITKIRDDYYLQVPKLDENGKPQFKNTKVVMQNVPLFPLGMPRELNINIYGSKTEIRGLRALFTSLSSIISFITILILIVLVNYIFKSQKREMGIMKAEGISVFKLGLGFALAFIILIIIGTILGTILGLGLTLVFFHMYQMFFMLEDFTLKLDVLLKVQLDLLLVNTLTLIIVYFISIRRNLKKKTLTLVKNIDKEHTPKVHLLKILPRNMAFESKYKISIFFRNFAKSIMLCFAVFISSFLILFAGLTLNNIYSMKNNTYLKVFKYEYVALFSEPNIITQDSVKYPSIQKNLIVDDYTNKPTDEESKFKTDSVQVSAYDYDNNDMINLHDIDGKNLYHKDGITVSSGVLKKFDIKVGDYLVVQNPFKEGQTVKLKIVDETSEFFMPYIYSDIDYFQEQFGLNDNFANGYFSESVLTPEKRAELEKQDPDVFINEKFDLQKQIDDLMYFFVFILTVISALAFIIAFVSLFSITNIIIESNKKQISVMKVLGYSNKEIKNMTIGIYKYVLILIYIISLPLLLFLIQSILNYATRDLGLMIRIGVNIPYLILGFFIILFVYLLSSFLSYRSIKKISLAQSIKADE
ncbi:MAG: ABC transporter permease [Mycoplasmatales bacterium]